MATKWLDNLSVKMKLLLIPIIFAASLLIIVFEFYNIIQDRRHDSEIGEYAIRQRSFNQRFLKETLLDTQTSGNKADVYPLLKETAAALLNGGSVVVTGEENKRVMITGIEEPEVRTLLEREVALIDQMGETRSQLRAMEHKNQAYTHALNKMQQTSDELHDVITQIGVLMTVNTQKAGDAAILRLFAVAILVSIFGFLLSMGVSQAVVVPLHEVVDIAEFLARGDFTRRIVLDGRKDELGKLQEAFKKMVDTLGDSTKQSMDVSQGVASQASQILATAQQQAATTKEQASAISQTTATMEEIGQSNKQVADRARSVASAAESTSNASDDGLKAVESTAQAMTQVRTQIETVAEHVLNLSEKAQAISEIIDQVNDISQKTHLLALNASIEAAAAGDNGRSFLVVADEMKNLADQAKDATVQVRSLLMEIQKGINSSVMFTEEAVKRVETGKDRADVSFQTMKELRQIIQESFQAFQQIIAAVNQQTIGFDQVRDSLLNLKKSAEENAAGTSQLQMAVSSLNAAGQQLRKNMERYVV